MAGQFHSTFMIRMRVRISVSWLESWSTSSPGPYLIFHLDVRVPFQAEQLTVLAARDASDLWISDAVCLPLKDIGGTRSVAASKAGSARTVARR